MASSIMRAAADLLDEAAMVVRLARDLPGFLRAPVPPADAEARLRRRLEGRAPAFLAAVERTVYHQPASPYRRMLRHAGCEPGDLRALVAAEGVEGALAVLAERGVYVTFDELKGRRPIVRGSLHLDVSDRDFDSPLTTAHYLTYTGGTGGQPSRVGRPLPYVREIGESLGATAAAHGIDDAEHAFWLTNPITTMLLVASFGHPTIFWAQPLRRVPWRGRLGARYIAWLGRRAGRPIPEPRLLDLQQAGRLARWLDRRRRAGRALALHTVPSSAVRVADAARAAGIDLGHVVFWLQSEPLTAARDRQIAASGARSIVVYTSIEISTIGASCAAPDAPDDVHLFSDRYAAIEREREAAPGIEPERALLFTTLTETPPKIALNAELGDAAELSVRDCACRLGAHGLRTHLTHIRSFEKLSGEGVTFARANLLRVLESVLPGRFGGGSVDYQLAEEEAADTSTRLVLRISPAVGTVDERLVCEALLAELARGGPVDANHAELLRRAGSVVVVREPPQPTAAGKVFPFRPLRPAPR